MKTDNHFIYIGDCVNKLKWFKMRSFFYKKRGYYLHSFAKYRIFARLLIRYLRNNGLKVLGTRLKNT